MKPIKVLWIGLLAGAALALVPSRALAQTGTNWTSQATNGIKGIAYSVHDFTQNQNYWLAGATKTWVQFNNMCGVCHTIHHSDANAANIAPLWTHTTSALTFQPYTSPTMAVTPGQPGYGSLACLSCHDGSVAVNDTGGKIQGGTAVMINAGNTALIAPAGDLTHTHPVSFAYNTAVASASDLNPDSTVVFGSGGKSIKDFMLFGGNVNARPVMTFIASKATR